MTAPGDGTGGPSGDDGPADGSAPVPRSHRGLLVAAAVLGVLAVVGVVGARAAHDGGATDPMAADAPFLAHYSFRPTGSCAFAPERGGLVAHFDLRTHDTGQLTFQVEAVTAEGDGDLDITTPHAVRVTVPFYAGQTRKQLDVVVPLSRSDYESGYRKCRFTLNPNGAD